MESNKQQKTYRQAAAIFNTIDGRFDNGELEDENTWVEANRDFAEAQRVLIRAWLNEDKAAAKIVVALPNILKDNNDARDKLVAIIMCSEW